MAAMSNDGRATWPWVIALAAAAAIAVFVNQCAVEDRGTSAAEPASTASAQPTSARRDGRGWTGIPQAVSLATAEIVSTPGGIGVVEGYILSRADGAPVAGAELTFQDGEAFAVHTSSQGQFRFAPTRASVYSLSRIRADGYLTFGSDGGQAPFVFSVHQGRSLREVRIYLTPAIAYAVTVTDREGNGVAGADVTSVSAGALVLPPEVSVTDAQGVTELVAPDDAIIEARHAEHGRGRARVDVSAQVSRRLLIVLGTDLPDRVRLAGRVVDEERRPVGEANVVARYQPENPASPTAQVLTGAQTTTGDDGRFEIEVDFGSYVVTASAEGWSPAVVRNVAAPGEDLELILERGSGIFGRVTEERTGEPIPSFVVVVSRRVGAVQREVIAVEPTFDAAGEYYIPSFSPGAYELNVVAQGFVGGADKRVEVGDQDVEANFELGRGATITGKVVDAATDHPIAGANVSVEGQLVDAVEVPIIASAITDESGRFVLRGVGRGPQSLFVVALGHHARALGGIGLPGTGTANLTIELTPVADGESPSVELVGIGAVMAAKGDVLIIGQVVDGGGAAEAGLIAGDEILAVDGLAVGDLGFAGSIQRIRGPEGSVVSLLVRRAETASTTPVAVVRRRILAP
jgi:hypothetical protein